MAVNSPRMPRGRPRTATVTQSAAGSLRTVLLLKDFQSESAIDLHARSAQNGPDGAGRPALFTNYFSKVARGNLQLQHCSVFAIHTVDGRVNLFVV
jgi:hypothetical protein